MTEWQGIVIAGELGVIAGELGIIISLLMTIAAALERRNYGGDYGD